MMIERREAFNFWGPQTLLGPELKAGDSAPDFSLITNKFERVTRATFADRPLLISVVPSLDTGVCSKQTIRFNEAAAELSDRATFLTISADLPFAQARWCGSNGANHIQTLSDHRDLSFGSAYGTAVKDLRFESRAVFVVDASGTIAYAEYVPSAGNEPDYDAALAMLKEVL
jgi:thiol peroxidase